MAEQVDLRPAIIAADGLRIVAAALRRDVLLVAGLAHRELLHARALAVVRHGLEDGQARAAGRAVDEGVQVAAVFGVEELGAALVAGRDVRRDEDVAALLGALDDGKIRIGLIGVGHLVHIDLEDGRALGGLLRDALDKLLQCCVITLGKDFDIGALVADGAAYLAGVGEPAHERAEADTLHDAVDLDVQTFHRLNPQLLIEFLAYSSVLDGCMGALRPESAKCGRSRRVPLNGFGTARASRASPMTIASGCACR